MVEMERAQFEDCVRDALDLIPADLAAQIDNVVVLVEDESPADGPQLLGLYDGVPLTERTEWWAAGSMPDRIYIYRNPILGICSDRDQVVQEVRITVIHELAHYFGIDDERLDELGWG